MTRSWQRQRLWPGGKVCLLIILVLACSHAATTAALAAGSVDGVRTLLDVPYGSAEDGELLLDVYRPPPGPGLLPVVIAIHGGGWVSGDKLRFEPQSRALARAGFLVLDINYSLDPSLGPGYPRQVQDVMRALAWAEAEVSDYDGDPRRIAVVGGSAGGYLAAMLGIQANTAGRTRVRGVASLSGPMDFVAIAADLRDAQEARSCGGVDCAVLEKGLGNLRSFLGCNPLRCPIELLREASPTNRVTPESPPFYLVNSTEETIPAGQAELMAEALRGEGVAVQLELLPGSLHSVEYLPQISRSLLGFLRTTTSDASNASISPASPAPSGPLWRWLLLGASAVALVAIATLAPFRVRRRQG